MWSKVSHIKIPSYHGLGESLSLESVAGEARLVGEPFLVDVLVHAREDTKDLARPETEKCSIHLTRVSVNQSPVSVVYLCVTTMFAPMASWTSMDSVFLVSQGRAMKA